MNTAFQHRIHSLSWLTSFTRSLIGRLALIAFACLALTPLCAAQGSESRSSLAKPLLLRGDMAKIIYVTDFELDPGNFKQDKGGITGKGYLLPSPPKSFRRKRQDSATEAGALVNLMAASLVADLEKSGFTARRLSSADARPTEGLLVSGAFAELDEGNQMRRALLGFGSGKAKIQIYVAMTDLSNAGQLLYDTSARKKNGISPGAAIALNPYVGAASFAAKFAITKNAPEKMVKKTASRIADELTRQLTQESLVASNRVTDSH